MSWWNVSISISNFVFTSCQKCSKKVNCPLLWKNFKLSCRPQLNVQVLFTTMRMWFKPDFRRYCCDLLLCSYREYESDLRSNEHYLSSSEIYDFHIFTVIYVHTILSYYLFRGKWPLLLIPCCQALFLLTDGFRYSLFALIFCL